jgi:serine/threonine protein kinase
MDSSIKFIAQGANGCVYKGMACDNDSEIRPPNKDYITKVVAKGDEASELKSYIRLNNIFRNAGIVKEVQNYVIIGADNCVVVPDNKYDDVIKGKCLIKSPYKFISQENAGSFNLTQKLKDSSVKHLANFYIKIFIGLENIFKGVHLLNSNDIYIFDLKSDNIVYNEKTHLCKIIDIESFEHFDTTTPREVIHNKIGGLKGVTVKYLSPELLYRNLQDFITGATTATLIYAGEAGLGNPYIKFIKDDDKKTIEFKNAYIGTDKTTFDYYLTLDLYKRFIKNDIWALGIILLEIVLQINEELDNIDDDDEAFDDNEMDKFTAMDIQSLVNLIRSMMKLNIDARIDSTAALMEYTRWVDKIRILAPHKSAGGKKMKKRKLSTKKKQKRKQRSKKQKSKRK